MNSHNQVRNLIHNVAFWDDRGRSSDNLFIYFDYLSRI